MSTLIFSGHTIRVDGEMTCLTDMWKANGSDPSQRPTEWARIQATVQFVEFLEETMVGNTHHESFRVVRDGGNVATFAHWQIALAYAKYLSPAFHAWCNTVVRDHMAGKLKPIALPSRTEVARMLLAESERADRLEAENLLLAPKAAFHDRVADSNGCYLIGDVAKSLGFGQNLFFAKLRADGIIALNSTIANQLHINAGRFKVFAGVHDEPNGTKAHFTTRVTGKGFVWLAKRYGKPGVEYRFPGGHGPAFQLALDLRGAE